MKICRRCGRELPLDEFYVHKDMADGHLNICKECVKARVTKHRYNNLEKIHEYDRVRSNSKKRKALRRLITKRRRKETGYQKAHRNLERNVKKGTVKKPMQCQCCGKKARLEAHHMDYDRELEVIWLCVSCHRQYHLGKTKTAEKIREKVYSLYRRYPRDVNLNGE